MVHSLKPSFVASGNNPTGVALALGEIIHSGSLEFTANHLGRLSLSYEESDSDPSFVGMVHSGLPSLHTTLENSSGEGHTISGAGRSSESPNPRGCNVETLTVPITTTPASESTPAF
jgi:hypothetical protein